MNRFGDGIINSSDNGLYLFIDDILPRCLLLL